MGCWFMKALYSNFDHRFIKASYDLIIKSETNEEFEHCAWNFYGKIGKINNKFSETIMQNGIVVEIIEDDSLENLIKRVNEKYGHE